MKTLTTNIFGVKSMLFAMLFAVVLLPQAAFAQAQWSMGYWFVGDGMPISELNPYWGGLTHVAFVNGYQVQSNGTLNSPDNSQNAAFISAAHSHGVKVIVDFFDGSHGWANAVQCCNSTLVNNIANVVNAYGFDGVNIDWEGSWNKSLLQPFFSALRTALGPNKLVEADAFPCCQGGSAQPDADWTSSIQYIDRLAIMNYDLVLVPNGPFSWFNSPLFGNGAPNSCCNSAAGDLQSYAAGGIPASKLLNGMAFYGWTYNGVSGPRIAGGSAGNQINYSRIVASYNVASAVRDSVTQTPWIPYSGGYVTYDDPQSITAKVNYVKSQGYGGWMMFTLVGDRLADHTHPLLAAIQAAMGGSGGGGTTTPTAPAITSSSPLPSGTVGVAYSTTLTAQ